MGPTYRRRPPCDDDVVHFERHHNLLVVRSKYVSKLERHSLKLLALPSWAFALVAGLLLTACETNPTQPTNVAPVKAELQFTDLGGFDRELADSLSSLPKVDVTFYDRITPSALPTRLQTWMASVEAGGGKVTVVPPKSRVTAKSPLMLLSAVSALWSASKVAKEYAAKALFDPAQAYDAQIVLKQDEKGDSVIDKVVFLRRQKP